MQMEAAPKALMPALRVWWPTRSRALLATGLLRRPLSEPDAGALSVLIDEHDAGFLKCPSDRMVVWRRQRGLVLGELSATNGGNAYGRLAGEIFGAPSQESPRRSDLGASQRPFALLHMIFKRSFNT
jgi:hypothetical protein